MTIDLLVFLKLLVNWRIYSDLMLGNVYQYTLCFKKVYHPATNDNFNSSCQIPVITSAEEGAMFLVRSVCLFVCLSVCLSIGLLANLWTDFDEIFWRGRAWLKDQVIQFWWRSGSHFGSGSPKSEIRILRIGGGLCSLSTSSFWYKYYWVNMPLKGDLISHLTCLMYIPYLGKL